MDMMGTEAERVEDLSKEELSALLTDAAKNWLAHDGVWFQTVERAHGLEEAVRCDAEAWRRFAPIEAKRIMGRLGMEPGGGIPALVKALRFRLYAHINRQEVVEADERRCVFRMVGCRVQEARKRRGMPDFPCKPVGIVEFSGFAKTIDPRISTRCVACPPDPRSGDFWCAWEFTIDGTGP